MIGLGDQREALVARDLYSGLIQVCPVASKNTDDAAHALARFRGVRAFKLLYIDGAAEFKSSRRAMHICHETSQPGISRNSGIIERASQDTQLGTAACLLQAGLPAQLWPFAAP